jgi:hypothetical protein
MANRHSSVLTIQEWLFGPQPVTLLSEDSFFLLHVALVHKILKNKNQNENITVYGMKIDFTVFKELCYNTGNCVNFNSFVRLIT